MKVLTKYTVTTILKIGLLTSSLAALMLMGVDLFKNLDSYTTYKLSGMNVFILTVLYFPEAFLLGIGPSFLFAITYYLSQSHASNEYIGILNSGIKYSSFLKPCIYTGLAITVLFFVFNETVALTCSNTKESMYKQLTNSSDENNDNSKIALSDSDNGYLVYAEDYIDSSQTLYNVSFIQKDDYGRLTSRTNAYKAVWNKNDSCWVFYDSYVYTPSPSGETLIDYKETIKMESFNLEPQLFRNLSAQVSKMSLRLAIQYIKRIKTLNPSQFASMATDFYKRVLSCITPLVMVIIACCLNYKFKKNVMFFSLICSVCIAVVYYVIQMVTIMLADQGVILPILGMLIPLFSIIVLTSLLSLFVRN